MKRNKKFIIGIIILVLLFGIILFPHTEDEDSLYIKTDDGLVKVMVEVAHTSQEKMRGLMLRDRLEEGHGMLFPYEEDVSPNMWMKNMEISLDIIFIGSDLKIHHIAKNTPPCRETDDSKCPRYGSEKFSHYVLEVPAGFTDSAGIETGNFIDLPLSIL